MNTNGDVVLETSEENNYRDYKVVLGTEEVKESVFGKKFKIRVTSKQTGKKIDINVDVKQPETKIND